MPSEKKCGRCGTWVPASSKVGQQCPYCGAYWGYESHWEKLRRRLSSIKCDGCGTGLNATDYSCPECGHIKWAPLVVATTISIICIGGGVISYLAIQNRFWRYLISGCASFIGLSMLLLPAVEIAKAIQNPKPNNERERVFLGGLLLGIATSWLLYSGLSLLTISILGIGNRAFFVIQGAVCLVAGTKISFDFMKSAWPKPAVPTNGKRGGFNESMSKACDPSVQREAQEYMRLAFLNFMDPISVRDHVVRAWKIPEEIATLWALQASQSNSSVEWREMASRRLMELD